jgi:two-component system, OmpR family, response regulator
MKLLYVEDDRINVLLFEETCKLDPRLEVRIATTGADALAAARAEPPDVLVIDLHLPDTDGCALLAALRGIDGLAATPAFLCSAERPRDTAAMATRAGFTGCWSKPVLLAEILSDLSRLHPQG